MRAYEMHCHVKQVKRSEGRSSVARAAYQSASKIEDERTGITHDYTRKGGVEHSRIYLPDNASAALKEARERGQFEVRGKLWNATEAREKSDRAQTAHDIVLGFPAEFNAAQRREAGDALASELVRRYGCAVDIAYHTPSREGDKRNFHAHVLFTQRAFDEARPDGWAKGKFRDLAPDTKDKEGKPYLDADGRKTTRGKLEMLDLRAFIAGRMNEIAERDGLDVHTEHLSFKKRDLDREPTQKMGGKATDQERRGEPSDRGDVNREIRAINDNRERLKEAQNIADLQTERAKRGKADLTLEATVRAHPHYAAYSESVQARQAELTQAREKLEGITITQLLMGRRREFLDEIEARKMNLADAQQRLEDLTQSVQMQPQAESIEVMAARSKKQAETAAREAAERERQAEQYERNQKEISALTDALASRTTGQRIMGAITGRTAEVRSRVTELAEQVKAYEANKKQEEAFHARRGREHAEDQQKRKDEQRSRDHVRTMGKAGRSDDTPPATAKQRAALGDIPQGETDRERRRQASEEERRRLQAEIEGAQAAADMDGGAELTPEEKKAASIERFNDWANDAAEEQGNSPDEGLDYD